METITKIVEKVLLASIWIYTNAISPLFAPSCRHYPTCSSYSREAIKKHGPSKGLFLSARRLLRCRPGGTSGYDPVPDEKNE
tara:strand:- start:524 stop:769 length:246 start_codon:yes stop_codon:yes gene_type:complete